MTKPVILKGLRVLVVLRSTVNWISTFIPIICLFMHYIVHSIPETSFPPLFISFITPSLSQWQYIKHILLDSSRDNLTVDLSLNILVSLNPYVCQTPIPRFSFDILSCDHRISFYCGCSPLYFSGNKLLLFLRKSIQYWLLSSYRFIVNLISRPSTLTSGR